MRISRWNPLAIVGMLLLTLGCGGKSTTKLIAELSDSDPKIRRAAARELSDLQGDPNDAIAALALATTDADLEVREIAVAGLAHFGVAAISSEAALEKALGDPEVSVRLGAAKALQKIDPESTSYVPVILDALNAGNGAIFLDVGQMGASAKWAVPTLVKLLSHPQAGIRALAARTLGKIGVATTQGESGLSRSLRDTDPSVRKAAQRALAQIQPQTAAAE
jgi:HEAT repeat protein